MRLINTDTLELREFFDVDIPRYAILSHRWEQDEVSYQDYLLGQKGGLQGDVKIRSFCRLAKMRYKSEWAWIDTCCIDKSSSAELSEAINSMYRWYMEAEVCAVYMSDVNGLDDFEDSKWFTRGWTLQELLAPHEVDFYHRGWEFLGTRDGLAPFISRATTIRDDLLRSSTARAKQESVRQRVIRRVSVAEKMSWASKRITSRLEDIAYCLLGLFDVNMPLLYGEGEKAFHRLQQEILKISDDESIFAWNSSDNDSDSVSYGVLASTPGKFLDGSVRKLRVQDFGAKELSLRKPYEITNKGLRIETHLVRLNIDEHNVQRYGIPVRCASQTPPSPASPRATSSLFYPLVLPVVKDEWDLTGQRYIRHGDGPVDLDADEWDLVLQGGGYGNFDLRLSCLPKEEIFVSLDSFSRSEDDAWVSLDHRPFVSHA